MFRRKRNPRVQGRWVQGEAIERQQKRVSDTKLHFMIIPAPRESHPLIKQKTEKAITPKEPCTLKPKTQTPHQCHPNQA